jgi:hypothetical protein
MLPRVHRAAVAPTTVRRGSPSRHTSLSIVEVVALGRWTFLLCPIFNAAVRGGGGSDTSRGLCAAVPLEFSLLFLFYFFGWADAAGWPAAGAVMGPYGGCACGWAGEPRLHLNTRGRHAASNAAAFAESVG